MLETLKDGGVVFTGLADTVASLSDQDSFGRVAAVCWDCLLVLQDYVRAREAGDHTAGIREYLERVPPGYRAVPPKKFAGKETARTMQEWGAERVFPVPRSVNPDGQTVMEAHFKLGKVGMISPRMYYFDNYINDRHVYVGYIGPHLSNTKTN
jgi:hypothetical protein